MSLNFLRFNAFTLAEILITLGIIGVVSAITLPTVINNVNEHILIKQLHTAYSLLSIAFEKTQLEHGNIYDWWEDSNDTTNNSKKIFDYFAETLDMESCKPYGLHYRFCGKEYPVYKDIKTGTNQYFWGHKGRLKNGMLLAFRPFANNYGNWAQIIVDVNGEKRPNIVGKDVFAFYIGEHSGYDYTDFSKRAKLTPQFFDVRLLERDLQSCLDNLSERCAVWVLEFDNMDYLHCHDKLSSKGPYSCK